MERMTRLEHGLYAVKGAIAMISEEQYFEVEELHPDEDDAMERLSEALRAWPSGFKGDKKIAKGQFPNFCGSSYSVNGESMGVAIWGQAKELGKEVDGPQAFMQALAKVGGLFVGTKLIETDGTSFGLWQKSPDEFIVYLGDDD